MASCGALTSWSPGDIIPSGAMNTNFSALRTSVNTALFTDEAGTCTVSHNFNATQYIGDTSNAGMTKGLTINQGAATDEILAFKNSGVAHGMTTLTETDTYGYVSVASTLGSGGLFIAGLGEAERGISLYASGTIGDTAKSTAALAPLNFSGRKKSGTTSGAMGANENVMVVFNGPDTKYIWDAEGSAHADVEWVAFDDHDDLAVIEDLETLMAPDQVRRQFGEIVRHDRAFFERAGLLNDVREVAPGRMSGFLNTTRALMLALGAIRQLGGRVVELERRLLTA